MRNAGDRLGAERFVQEIKTTAALSHPHILPLFDSGQGTGDGAQFLYYVMPYVEGESLRDRLAREDLPLEDAIEIAREMAGSGARSSSRTSTAGTTMSRGMAPGS